MRAYWRAKWGERPKQGTVFYRIVDRFIIQGGGSTDSVFGGPTLHVQQREGQRHFAVLHPHGPCPALGWPLPSLWR
ncbi:hypothetical protein HaLaN_27703, partial [Haematococcus lacustris]